MKSKIINLKSKIKTKKSYTTQYTNPIILNKGDVVILGEEETKQEWLGWIWAFAGNVSGWIPKQIVISDDWKTGSISEDYSAKELNVGGGDEVIIIRELNGWYRVKNSDTGEEGWVPGDVLDV